MKNENNPENDNIYDYDDPQLDTTNDHHYAVPPPDPIVEANYIRHSTRIRANPQRLISSLNVLESYERTAATTILEQDYVDLVGTNYHPDYD